MPSDWKPNAPALKKHFDQTPKPAPRRIASALELKQLEKQRQPPAPQLQLKMRGPDAAASAAQASRQREVRIGEIKERLALQRERAQKQFQRHR